MILAGGDLVLYERGPREIGFVHLSEALDPGCRHPPPISLSPSSVADSTMVENHFGSSPGRAGAGTLQKRVARERLLLSQGRVVRGKLSTMRTAKSKSAFR